MLQKFYLTLSLVTFYFVGLNAQTEKGTVAIGLYASPKISAHQDRDNNHLELHGEFQAGYFLRKNWQLGGELSLTRFRSKTDGEIDSESNTYRLGAFTKKYFEMKSPKWKPFIGAGVGMSFKQEMWASGIGLPDENSIGAYGQAEGGIAYFFNPSTSMHLSLYTLYDQLGDRSHITSGLKIGFTHSFNGKKKN